MIIFWSFRVAADTDFIVCDSGCQRIFKRSLPIDVCAAIAKTADISISGNGNGGSPFFYGTVSIVIINVVSTHMNLRSVHSERGRILEHIGGFNLIIALIAYNAVALNADFRRAKCIARGDLQRSADIKHSRSSCSI